MQLPSKGKTFTFARFTYTDVMTFELQQQSRTRRDKEAKPDAVMWGDAGSSDADDWKAIDDNHQLLFWA